MFPSVAQPVYFIDRGINSIGCSRPWFEQRLKELKIQIDPKSGLGQSLAELRRMEEMAKTGEVVVLPAAEVQRRFLSATGADFLSKALHWGQLTQRLDGFADHWKLLKSGNPVLTGPSDSVHSRHRARTWELVLASLAATFATKVHQAEPDVVCEWNGQQIGLAAKVLFTRSKSAFRERLEEGIQQIHDQADITSGCVVINLVESYPHADEFSAFHRMRHKHPNTIAFSTTHWVSCFLEEYGPTELEWTRLFKGKTKLMTIAMFLPTVLTLWRGYAVPMSAYRFHLYSSTQREREAVAFTTALQKAFEDTLGFRAATSLP